MTQEYKILMATDSDRRAQVAEQDGKITDAVSLYEHAARLYSTDRAHDCEVQRCLSRANILSNRLVLR